MELKLSFFKNCIDASTLHLTVKSPRKVFPHHSKGSLTSRNPQKKSKVSSNSNLYPEAAMPLCLLKPEKNLVPDRIGLLSAYSTHRRQRSKDLSRQERFYTKLPSESQSIIEITPPRARNKSFSSTQAEFKIKDFNNKAWMSKHNARNNDEGLLMKFAAEFFTEMDKNALGAIPGNILLEALLSLGIATDSDVLRDTLAMIFHCSDLEKFQIGQQDFLSMFRSDVITDLILEQLNENSLAERKKVKVLTQRKAKIKSANGKNRAILTFKKRLALAMSGGEADIEKNLSTIITINEHLAVIEKLWEKYCLTDEGITILTACQVFKYFKIFQDNFECKKYIISVLGQVQSFRFKDFQQLFAKSMLKGAFANLSKRLFEENYAEKEMSSGFKISAYQRALLMSGVRCPNSNISIQEGERIVTALEKFQNFPKTTYEELRRKLLIEQGKSEVDREKDVIKILRERKVVNELKNISKRFFRRKSKITSEYSQNSEKTVRLSINPEITISSC